MVTGSPSLVSESASDDAVEDAGSWRTDAEKKKERERDTGREEREREREREH